MNRGIFHWFTLMKESQTRNGAEYGKHSFDLMRSTRKPQNLLPKLTINRLMSKPRLSPLASPPISAPAISRQNSENSLTAIMTKTFQRRNTINKLKRFATTKKNNVSDIMDIAIVKQNCIRVYGSDSTHVIDVKNLSPKDIRAAIHAKFRLDPLDSEILVAFDENLMQVDDESLVHILDTPVDTRPRLYVLPISPTKQDILKKKRSKYSINKSLPPLPPESLLPRPPSTQPTKLTYIKTSLLGIGSFGKVYLALDIHNKSYFALKQVSLFSNRKVIALQQEISLLRKFKHENIVEYLGFDVEEKDGIVCLFLEYVKGWNLAGLYTKIGRFEEDLVSFLARQILKGLVYLHDIGIIHRDIKGANVLIDEQGITKISDFGISKRFEYQAAYRKKHISMQGSVPWMAPELILNQQCSAKIDIYSFGCVLIEVFEGKRPWFGCDDIQTIWKVKNALKPVLNREISDGMRNVIDMCLKAEPDLRPTARDLLNMKEFEEFEFDFGSHYRAKIDQRPSSPFSLSSSASSE